VHIKRRFEVGNLYKFYTALTCGVPKPLAGVIDIPIGIDTKTKHGIYRVVVYYISIILSSASPAVKS